MPQVEVNGEKMYIPQSGMEAFTKDYPEANIHYAVGNDTLSIPFKNSQAFLKDYPTAKTIGDEEIPLMFEKPNQVSRVLQPEQKQYGLSPEMDKVLSKPKQVQKSPMPNFFTKDTDIVGKISGKYRRGKRQKTINLWLCCNGY
jgi:hypothetical protein